MPKETKKTEEENVTYEKKTPTKKIRAGRVEVSVWRQTGVNGIFHTATPSKNWQDKDGEWQKGNSYTEKDIRDLSFCLSKAQDYMYHQKEDDEGRDESE